MNDAAVLTYRYLRISIVVLAVYLGIAVGIETRFDGDRWLGSISAYYYTPVRSVFVGTLTAMAIGLIAIKGRDARHEDLLLNIAGMLAPVVAVVPTPIPPREGDDPCAGSTDLEPKKCIPDEFTAYVHNNIQTLIVVGVLGLLLIVFLAWKADRLKTYRRELLIGTAVLGAFTLWYVGHEPSFFKIAHYAAAIPMFVLVCWVAVSNAKSIDRAKAEEVNAYSLMGPERYQQLYWLIALAMFVAVGLTAIAFSVNLASETERFPHWVFLIEAALLALFSCFWVLQTMQFWKLGAPPEPVAS